MSDNNYQKQKTAALRKILTDKINGIKSNFDVKIQENEISNQNNMYRSSSPWYLLLSESNKIKNDLSHKKNDKYLCGFEFENYSAQKIIDAAFSKTLDFVSNYEELETDDVREMMVNYLEQNRVMDRKLNEIVKAIKKMNIDVLSDY